MNLRTKRKAINLLALCLSLAAMAFGLFWLIWILWMVFEQGISSLSLTLATENTPPPGSAGGGRAHHRRRCHHGYPGHADGHAGRHSGRCLSEYGRTTWLGKVTRFVGFILLSAPSIVIGLFVYAVYVAQLGKFSGFSGAIALALLVVPVVVRTTEHAGAGAQFLA